MSGKKIAIMLLALATLFAIVVGSLALYVYNLDCGVDYKGRVRLDYNWKYYFAACPKKEYKHEGKLFSFSYPSSSPTNPIREFAGLIVSDDHLLDIVWSNKDPAPIKSELSAHLSAGGTDLSAFSEGFMQWLLREPDKVHPDSDKLYNKHLEKINFRSGGSAILISLRSKVEQRSYYKFMVGITPGGYVFIVRNMVRLNASEATYRELMFNPFWTCTVYPDPARDAKSACVLNRFLQTFEFKK